MKTLLAILVLGAQQQRPREGGPEAGQEAPNFTAKVLGSKESVELKKVLEAEKKPVVLIFGSYT